MQNDDLLRDDELDQKEVNDEFQETEQEQDIESQLKERDDEIAKLKTILIRNKQKLEEKGNKEPLQEQPKIEDDVKATVQQLKLAEDKRQFGYENGLSPQEVDAIFKINPNPSKETLEDPFVKGGLERIRSQNRTEANTPRSSSRSGSLTSLKNAKKPATKADLQSAFEKKRDNFLRGK